MYYKWIEVVGKSGSLDTNMMLSTLFTQTKSIRQPAKPRSNGSEREREEEKERTQKRSGGNGRGNNGIYR